MAIPIKWNFIIITIIMLATYSIIMHISKIRHIFRTVMFDFLRRTYNEGISTELLIEVSLHLHTHRNMSRKMCLPLSLNIIFTGGFVYTWQRVQNEVPAVRGILM